MMKMTYISALICILLVSCTSTRITEDLITEKDVIELYKEYNIQANNFKSDIFHEIIPENGTFILDKNGNKLNHKMTKEMVKNGIAGFWAKIDKSSYKYESKILSMTKEKDTIMVKEATLESYKMNGKNIKANRTTMTWFKKVNGRIYQVQQQVPSEIK